MFVIEDEDDEMFGFYFNKQISLNANYIESDDKSFYFILNSCFMFLQLRAKLFHNRLTLKF